jgi:hypothetical protein
MRAGHAAFAVHQPPGERQQQDQPHTDQEAARAVAPGCRRVGQGARILRLVQQFRLLGPRLERGSECCRVARATIPNLPGQPAGAAHRASRAK